MDLFIGLEFTIPLCPRTKKNSNQICRVGTRRYVLPSAAYREYEEAAVAFLGRYARHIDFPVNVRALYYLDSRRRIDISNLTSALDDVLVIGGVLTDDCRDVIASHDGSRAYYDKLNPRTEVTITPAEDGYTVWRKQFEREKRK